MPRKTVEEWVDDPLIEKIARVSYAAMREWCIVTNQEIAGPWDKLSIHHHEHLKIIVARAFVNMKVPTAKELHDRCYEDGMEAGWTQADKIDLRNKQHPDVVPWAMMSTDQRMKDFLMSSILRAFLEG